MAQRQNIHLPRNPDEYEISVDRRLESNLRRRFVELKRNHCQFILCLENCRNSQVHEQFKNIAYNEFGKCCFDESF